MGNLKLSLYYNLQTWPFFSEFKAQNISSCLDIEKAMHTFGIFMLKFPFQVKNDSFCKKSKSTL